MLTAGTIMQPPLVTTTDRDDPEEVLCRLGNVEGVGAYVLNDAGQIAGVTRVDPLTAAVGQHRTALTAMPPSPSRSSPRSRPPRPSSPPWRPDERSHRQGVTEDDDALTPPAQHIRCSPGW